MLGEINMATTAKKPLFLGQDVLYVATFTLGFGAFWLSGRVASLLVHAVDRHIAGWVSLAVTAGVYGLILGLWTIVALRKLSLKAMLGAAIPAVILGMVAAQGILRLASGHIHSLLQVGLLTFALYICYGAIYVLGLVIARRLAR
jgi:hypothetical protein